MGWFGKASKARDTAGQATQSGVQMQQTTARTQSDALPESTECDCEVFDRLHDMVGQPHFLETLEQEQAASQQEVPLH